MSFQEFAAFYRSYAQSGIHAATAAALTALGLLMVFHWGFAVLAITVYVIPPVYLYLTTSADDEHVSMRSGDRNSHAETAAISDDLYSTEPVSKSDVTAAGDGWTAVDSPTETTLYDIAISQDGPYVVGDGGEVLTRRDDGWEVVLEKGPTVQSNPLRGAAASSDGRAVWFAGDSGVIGQYDVRDKRFTDYSAPNDMTSSWEDIAIVGAAGEEMISLVNASGVVLHGNNAGGTIEWGPGMKPGSGSSMTGIEFIDENHGYICDTNQTVYETTTGGERYESIGIDTADTDFRDIAAVTPDTITIAGGDGTIFRYDGAVWTQLYVSEHALSAIDRRGEEGLASSSDGTIYGRTQGGWDPIRTPTNDTLHGVIIGTDVVDVAVGTDGAILEHHR